MMSRKRWFLLIAIAVLIIGGVSAAVVIKRSHASPIPQAIQRAASFPLYYPATLPAGWSIEEQSFSQAENVVLFRASDTHDTSKIVSISIQPQQEAFNLDRFYEQTLAKSTQFTTPLGQAAVGEGEHQMKIGSLVTGESWILITSKKDTVTNTDLRAMLTSLRHN